MRSVAEHDHPDDGGEQPEFWDERNRREVPTGELFQNGNFKKFLNAKTLDFFFLILSRKDVGKSFQSIAPGQGSTESERKRGTAERFWENSIWERP